MLIYLNLVLKMTTQSAHAIKPNSKRLSEYHLCCSTLNHPGLGTPSFLIQIINIHSEFVLCYPLCMFFSCQVCLTEIDSLAGVGGQIGFPEGLGDCGMRVADSRNVFAAGAVFHGENGFVDYFTGDAADEVDAEDFVCFLIGENFDESVRIVIAFRPTVGRKREFADFVHDSHLFELFFRFAHPSHFRVSVDDGGNAVIVDVDRAACDACE